MEDGSPDSIGFEAKPATRGDEALLGDSTVAAA